MTERPASLFERPVIICYCVPGGASQCAPCRDRKHAEAPRAEPPLVAHVPRSGAFTGKKGLDAELDGPCMWHGCDGTYIEHHYGEGCSCHISPPCSWCTDTTLECDKCGDEGHD